MIRLLLRLLGIRDFEPNETVSILKQQLEYERSEKQRLIDTLLNILQPKVVEAAPVEINEIKQTSALFSRRRAALEEQARQRASVLRSSTNIGKPDIESVNPNINLEDNNQSDIEKLEAELNIEQKEA